MPAAVDSSVARPTRCFQRIEVLQRIDFAHVSGRFAVLSTARQDLLLCARALIVVGTLAAQ